MYEASWQNGILQAFRGAAAAGVFVAAAAGNAYNPGTVDNAAPWTMTVAAGTHGRVVGANLTLGVTDGSTLQYSDLFSLVGATAANGVGPADVFYPGPRASDMVRRGWWHAFISKGCTGV